MRRFGLFLIFGLLLCLLCNTIALADVGELRPDLGTNASGNPIDKVLPNHTTGSGYTVPIDGQDMRLYSINNRLAFPVGLNGPPLVWYEIDVGDRSGALGYADTATLTPEQCRVLFHILCAGYNPDWLDSSPYRLVDTAEIDVDTFRSFCYMPNWNEMLTKYDAELTPEDYAVVERIRDVYPTSAPFSDILVDEASKLDLVNALVGGGAQCSGYQYPVFQFGYLYHWGRHQGI